MSEIWWKVPWKVPLGITRIQRVKERKTGGFGSYFHTFAEAHEFLLRRETKRLDGLRKDLARQEARVAKIQAMKEPS